MAVPSGRDMRRALWVREFLVSHLSEPLTLQDTQLALRANASAMSASTIQRALRATWGVRFHELVDRLRVERSLTLLAADPDLKIEPLARDVGWRGKTSLYAAVLRVTGHSLPELRGNLVLLRTSLANLRAGLPTDLTPLRTRAQMLAS